MNKLLPPKPSNVGLVTMFPLMCGVNTYKQTDTTFTDAAPVVRQNGNGIVTASRPRTCRQRRSVAGLLAAYAMSWRGCTHRRRDNSLAINDSWVRSGSKANSKFTFQDCTRKTYTAARMHCARPLSPVSAASHRSLESIGLKTTVELREALVVGVRSDLMRTICVWEFYLLMHDVAAAWCRVAATDVRAWFQQTAACIMHRRATLTQLHVSQRSSTRIS